MTEAHDKLRAACERAADAQIKFKAADSAGSGHVAAAGVLMEACADLSTHIPTILSLLDEIAVLRMAAGMHEHFVCPGCHAVDEEACLPGCIDAEIEGERRTPFDGFSEFMADDGDEPEEGGAS